MQRRDYPTSPHGLGAWRSHRLVGVAAPLLATLAIVSAAWAAPSDLDPAFSSDGRRTIGFGSGTIDAANAVAIQGDGKIVVAGDSGGHPLSRQFAVARFNANGSPDTSFSADARRTIGIGNGNPDQVEDVAIQANGKIVLAGWVHQPSTGYDFAVARLNANGSPDTGFSGDGRRTLDFGSSGTDEGHDVAIQSDGRIVVAGYSQGATDFDFAVARFNADGSPDSTFSGEGRRTIGFGSGTLDVANAMAIQNDGKIVLGGYTVQGGEYDFALARLNANGSPDTGFSGDARRAIGFANAGGRDLGNDVAIQANGKIVVAGYSDQGATDDDFAVARFNANGSPDTGFSDDGRRTIGYANGSGRDLGHGVAIQANGKIVVAGYSDQGATDDDFAVARFNANGSPDTGFSGDGRRTVDFGSGVPDFGQDVAIQANGRIVVAGASGAGETLDFAVARLLGG